MEFWDTRFSDCYPNLANGASASGFTLPPLHPLHPFARWARRARRRSPAAAAKLRLLHPIHREAFFLSKVGRDSGPQSYQHVPILKVFALLAFIGLIAPPYHELDRISWESHPGARSSMDGEVAEWQRCHCASLLPNDSFDRFQQTIQLFGPAMCRMMDRSSSHVTLHKPFLLFLVMRYVLWLAYGGR